MNCRDPECKGFYRYLDCDDCRKKDRDCIYVCTECGEEE